MEKNCTKIPTSGYYSDVWILLLAYKHVGGEYKALVKGTAPTSPTVGCSHIWLSDLGLTAFIFVPIFDGVNIVSIRTLV